MKHKKENEMDAKQLMAQAARYSSGIGGKQNHGWQGRVDRVFASLESQGIVARHDLSDCMTGGVEEIRREVLEFAKTGVMPIGYTFYHGQDTSDACHHGELCLAYDSISGDDKSAVEIGKKVRAALKKEGLPVKWHEFSNERISTWVKGIAPVGYEDEMSDLFPPISGVKP